MQAAAKEASKPVSEVSISDRVSLLGRKIEDLRDDANTALNSISRRMDTLEEQQGNINIYSRRELIDRLDTIKEFTIENFDKINKRLDKLERSAILKPDYNPAEVSFNATVIEGTFEWAIMHMKKGSKLRRDGDDYIYYFTSLGSLMQIQDDGGELEEDKLEEWELDVEDITATDWKIV